MRDELSENLKKKRELVEAAEALKDSIEWTETTNRLIELQAEWKKVACSDNMQPTSVYTSNSPVQLPQQLSRLIRPVDAAPSTYKIETIHIERQRYWGE